MSPQNRNYLLTIVVISLVACLGPLMRAAEPDAVAAAMTTLFSPDRSPPNRTMGLVQRNFLDLVEASKPKLQIALVIDGTASMDASLSGIKRTLGQMLDDISLYKAADVTYQLVVFRDSGSPAGEIVFPLGSKDFESDRQALQAAVDAIQPETGAPFFHELIDAGVHAGITELAWAESGDTTKWLLVIGDAPPFDVGFEDKESGARRRFETNHLAGLAAARGIKINCMLCASRESEREAYDAVIDKTRTFMSDLASETGGLMLDLSYAEIRKTLLASAKQPKTEYVEVGQITQAEVEALRREAAKANSPLAENQRVSIAVLPHVPLNAMTFDPDRPEVRVAADLRQRFRELSGVEVQSTRNVMRRFERLKTSGVAEEQVIQMLASALRVDYVVWGEVNAEPNLVQVSSGMYSRLDGKLIARGSGAQPKIADATTLAVRQVVNNVNNGPLTPMKSVLARLQQNQPTQLQLTPVSNNAAAFDAITTGYEALEQAAAFEVGAEEAGPLLVKARAAFEAAISADPRPPLPYLLLASCAYNEAQLAVKTGDAETAKMKFGWAKQYLREAKRNRNEGNTSNHLKTEIDADYALLGLGQAADAIPLYQQLTDVSSEDPSRFCLHTALRAHWMLAGIYSGDWGAEELKDVHRARDHLRTILAHWPQSDEAKYITSKLRWDSQAGKNRFEHLPQQNKPLLDLFES